MTRDRERMYKVLKKYAQGEGLQSWNITREDLEVFGIYDVDTVSGYGKLTRLLQESLHSLSTHKSGHDTRTAMIMLDLEREEQPTRRFEHRRQSAKRVTGLPIMPSYLWKNGLFAIVMNIKAA